MVIALHTRQRLGAEAHRVVNIHLKRMDKVLASVTEQKRDEVIHDTRAGMKRMRAFLRLLRTVMGETAYRLANEQSKALSNGLSDDRDARVLLDTMDCLLQEVADHECRERMRAPFEAHYQKDCASNVGLMSLKQARMRLSRLQEKSHHWHLKHYDQQLLRAAIAAEYDAGRQGWQQIQQQPEAATLHEWRKQVKRFYYQLSLLFPTRKTKPRACLKALGEYLGQLHDLHILQDYLTDHPHQFWTDDLIRLQRVSEAREKMLLERVWRLAPKAYAQPAEAYSRKLIQRWSDLGQKNP